MDQQALFGPYPIDSTNKNEEHYEKVISVRFKENGKSYYFDPAGPTSKPANM